MLFMRSFSCLCSKGFMWTATKPVKRRTLQKQPRCQPLVALFVTSVAQGAA
jgi:hypothetical protein